MNHPLLSIVICTHNRDTYLQKCLEHLAAQTVSSNLFEVMVVNNNSTDRTEEVCSNFSTTYPEIPFKYLTEINQGLSHCRNRAIKESVAPIISYIDDDSYAHPNYAESLIQYFKDHSDVDAIGGKITPVYQGEVPKWMSKYLLPLVASLDMGDRPKRFRGSSFPIGANMAFRRSALRHQGGFNPELGRKGTFLGSGEEKDLFYRLYSAKKIIHYVPEVHVFHSIPESRTHPQYIRRMAQGIGKSEAVRLRGSSLYQVASKWFQEFFKIGATLILAIYYALSMKWPQAKMLLKFRWWLVSSFIKS